MPLARSPRTKFAEKMFTPLSVQYVAPTNTSTLEIAFEPRRALITPDPSLVDGIQELVNTHGGVTDLVLLESGQPTPEQKYHAWYSFDSAPAQSAKLHIEYVVGPPPI